jgi:AmiR/NasT family two-component response regulator
MIDGKLKAGMEIRDALNATVAEYESLHSNVDNSGERANALAAVITNLTVELVDIQAKNPGRDITASIFVASEGHGPLVLHEGSE